MNKMIYLDNAATTFPKPKIVYETMNNYYKKYGVNAGRGSYNIARYVNDVIRQTRELIAKLVNFKFPNKIIFAPSATIAMNEIINGLEWSEYNTVYITPFEHNAVMRPLKLIKDKYNINIKILPFDYKSFKLDEEKMKLMFSQDYPDYIFMSHVSNVTGYILPIEKIIHESRKYNSIITIDCSQSMGLIPIDIEKLGADFLVFAGHKTLYGPFGIGGFIYNSKKVLNVTLGGGTGSDSLNLDMPNELPLRYEPASHNIQAIFGLNAALKWIKNTKIEYIKSKEHNLDIKLINGLNDIYGIKLYIPDNLSEHTSIVSLNLDGFNPNELGQVLDLDFNIAVRTGYHCAPLIHDFLNTKELGGTLRISLSYFNNDKQINYLLNSLEDILG